MGKPLGNSNQKNEAIIEVLPVLDKSKPYAEVCGLPGAAFEQGGKFFNKDGHCVKEDDCHPINDEKDLPQDEEYHDYNQVILQESPKPTPMQSKEIARSIIYGGEAA